jgi:type II secretory pathway component PulF
MMEQFHLWRVRSAFNKIRSAFYLDLASALDSGAPLKDLITKYAEINVGPISNMMRLWLEGFRHAPDSLARASREYVDAGDGVVIAAAETSKEPGSLYRTYAENLRLRASMVRSVKAPLILPIASLVLLMVIMKFFDAVVYAKMAKNVPLKFWPDYGAFSYHFLQAVFGLPGFIFITTVVITLCFFIWSVPYFTHPVRDFLDKKIFPYTVIAQMEMLSVFSVLAALIRSGASDVASLSLIITNASPWLAWQLDKVREETRKGLTVLGSLRSMPVSPMLSARLEVMSKTADMSVVPNLIIDACNHEAKMLVERMETTAKLVTVLVVLTLLAVVGILMAGILGFNDATQAFTDSMRRK